MQESRPLWHQHLLQGYASSDLGPGVNLDVSQPCLPPCRDPPAVEKLKPRGNSRKKESEGSG